MYGATKFSICPNGIAECDNASAVQQQLELGRCLVARSLARRARKFGARCVRVLARCDACRCYQLAWCAGVRGKRLLRCRSAQWNALEVHPAH